MLRYHRCTYDMDDVVMDNYHTDETNLHDIARQMSVASTVVKTFAMVLFITLLVIDYAIWAKSLVGLVTMFTCWWADANFLERERFIRFQFAVNQSKTFYAKFPFWNWSVAPYYFILMVSLLLLLLTKFYE